jgi:hypothetical protein
MQIRTLGMLTLLAVALTTPGIAEAGQKNGDTTKHGIGKGGVPALRDALQGQIDSLKTRVDDLEALADDVADLDARLQAIEDQFADDDGDTFSEVQGDCNDDDAAVNPSQTEVAANGIDDDCDRQIDEP